MQASTQCSSPLGFADAPGEAFRPPIARPASGSRGRRPSVWDTTLAWVSVRCYPAGSPEVMVDEDHACLMALARGDQKALAQLYDRYGGLLMAVGTRILSDRREVEDLLHDVFMEVWRQAKTYDPTRGSVRSWLALRMRSRALDRVRAAGRAKVVLSDAPESPDRPAEGTDPSENLDGRTVRAALAALPDEQRSVLELGYFGGLSSSEIAAELGIPIGTVKSRVARGLAQLRVGLAPAAGGGL